MLTLYFSNFYDMHIDEIKNYLKFFKILFNEDIQIINDRNSDILCESVFGYESNINYKKYKYSFLFSFENKLIDHKYLDKFSCILSGFTGLKNMITFPFFYWRLMETETVSFYPINKIPLKNIGAVISNGNSVRNNILTKIHDKVHIDFGGKFMNNVPKVEGFHWDNSLTNFYKQYKFGIAFENTIIDYYITEKIFNILKAGIIPIYFGTSKISEYINPKRFIQIKDDSDEEINRVVNIINNMTDEEYLNIINQPVLLKPYILTFNEILSEIKNKIFKENILYKQNTIDIFSESYINKVLNINY
jgi:hypothetical protein